MLKIEVHVNQEQAEWKVFLRSVKVFYTEVLVCLFFQNDLKFH